MTNSSLQDKSYDTILVIGKNIKQAMHLWEDVKDKFPKPKWEWGRVKFIGRNESRLDGLNPMSMLIVLIGEYQLNPVVYSKTFQMFKRYGAEIVEEGKD